MPELQTTLIRYGRLEPHAWRLHEGEGMPPDAPGWMVALATWQAHGPESGTRRHPLGIVLPTDADPADLGATAETLVQRGDVAFLAVHFPQYGDGRGFSLAWLLREEYGWRGELRALGDVLIDTVHYLARCGFDSFLPKPRHDAAEALAALQTFTEHYQAAYPDPALSLG
jgi:uncharacterized protein (DUF934 family)